MMKRLLILCEGNTEETFINRMLVPHLAELGISTSCTMICTSREQGRRAYRGGHLRKYDPIRKDLNLLLRSNPDALSTMLDLYAFPRDMPGFPHPWPKETRKRVESLSAAFASNIQDAKFIPGIIAHEFEGLLFSEPETIAQVVETEDYEREVIAQELRKIAHAYASPEDINDSPQTAPSKQLEKILPSYKKTRHGPLIAGQIGLRKLRERCPIFSEWLGKLEALGGQTA
jgi:hypothetical protein